MKQNLTSVDSGATDINVVLITLDNNLSAAVADAQKLLSPEMPGLNLTVHAATDWHENTAKLQACKEDIAKGDIIVASMLFVEEHVKAISDDLAARRDHCDAMVCCMSAGEIMKNTSMGNFKMDGEQKGPLALLRRLRGGGKKQQDGKTAGERQMRMLKRLPKLLKYIPGTAQDLRNYFLTLQYRLSASQDNIANMVRLLVDKYADGERIALKGKTPANDPVEYPETGIYHPSIKGRVSADINDLPWVENAKGTVGLLLLRSYILSGDTAHYNQVIEAYTKRGINVVPCFCNGLDNRPAIDRFLSGGKTGVQIDALVSLTGFSLVGGPAYSDAEAAAEALEKLDVPYIAAHVTEFQTLETWEKSDTGLMPIETTIMVAIPELDGAIGSQVFGGRLEATDNAPRTCNCSRNFGTCPSGLSCMHAHDERVEMMVSRTTKLIELRRKKRSERRIALTLFNFPPNAGNLGTAAFLSVFESLHSTLKRMKAEGYTVGDLPDTCDELRASVLEGNAAQHGALANVHEMIPADDQVRREPHLAQIEEAWGPAPGRDFTDGSSIFVLGKQFGNILVNVQPGFGYEGDPMRLLFEKSFAPTHAFSAFYRYLREDYKADAVLHFGTHGALEFMPGKQTGMSAACWPDRLIQDLPNFYLYAANNPSEGTIAKRRSAATLISYLTPPVAHAGLYKGLTELKSSLTRLNTTPIEHASEREDIASIIRVQAEQLDLVLADDETPIDDLAKSLSDAVLEMEYSLIPEGLHVIGSGMEETERAMFLELMGAEKENISLDADDIAMIASGQTPTAKSVEESKWIEHLLDTNAKLAENQEMKGLIHALDGKFVPPSPSGDLIRTPTMLPTGRNIHGFDPFRIPSHFAVRDGAMQAARILDRHLETENALPETIAVVLWGADNLKSEGGPIAQALSLMGARPRLDSYGRVTGAELIPLEELKRPRIDVVMTLSGIFRDLLPIQSKMLAEASYLAAVADEPLDQNFIRKHALAYAQAEGCDLEQAAYRVFSNAEGAYGSNVNFLIASSAWTSDDEIADTYTNRKCFAISRNGKTEKHPELMEKVLGDVELAYQNLDSIELGITTIDHYFDTLGGISKVAKKVRGTDISVYISDQTQGEGKVRTLGEQVNLETRTRSLNPKWFEGMLKHGAEGVRQIEAQVTNTMGWSATTGKVSPWVYQRLSEVYVLDKKMRDRLADLNPHASSRMINRLIEASQREFWEPDEETLNALQSASEELEDRLEGIFPEENEK